MQKPILFTGAFCSSEPWLEQMLSSFADTRYLPKFFSPSSDTGKLFNFNYKFPHLSHTTENEYHLLIKDFIGNDSESSKKTHPQGGLKKIYQKVVEKYQSFRENKPSSRTVIYDEYALFLTEWFYYHYRAETVILIQHPLEFVHNWMQKYSSTHLYEWFSPKVKRYAPHTEERLLHKDAPEWQKVLYLWISLAETVIYYQMHYPNWMYFRYEDLRSQPERVFSDIGGMLEIQEAGELNSLIAKTRSIRIEESQFDKSPFLDEIVEQTQDYLNHFYPRNIMGTSKVK